MLSNRGLVPMIKLIRIACRVVKINPQKQTMMMRTFSCNYDRFGMSSWNVDRKTSFAEYFHNVIARDLAYAGA